MMERWMTGLMCVRKMTVTITEMRMTVKFMKGGGK